MHDTRQGVDSTARCSPPVAGVVDLPVDGPRRVALFEDAPSWRCACGSSSARVVDSRPTAYGIRRRRECAGCGKRFTTSERFDTRSSMTETDALALCEALEGVRVLLDTILRRKRFRGGVMSPGALPNNESEV